SLFFEVQSPENRLEIDPNPFSPDGDGFEDFTAIQYVLDLETAFADLRIFDLRGRLIRHLSNGERIAREGRFVWDGRDDQGRTARIGAYVCLLQIFDANQQRQETLKKTMILVKRD
ncbi:MAG: gliding motility-associated C-terminal domain-containing protein, partial [Calditrichaeota bacterium]|nr:gliding motility-associated C-terminal domain-containing protein [Calditrichota bacterium]